VGGQAASPRLIGDGLTTFRLQPNTLHGYDATLLIDLCGYRRRTEEAKMSQVLCHLIAGVLTCAPFDISQIEDQRLKEECRNSIEMCRSMNVPDPRGGAC
jgi:hypothetical protein